MPGFNPSQPRDEFGRWVDADGNPLPEYMQQKMSEASALEEQDIAIMELMKKAKESGPEVDQLARSIAEKYNATVTPINYKSEESIRRKAKSEYGGDVTKISDAVRNTIVVENDQDLDRVLNAFYKVPGAKVKRQLPEHYIGYSGGIVKITTKNGLQAEIQVNIDRMIYAKERPEISKLILGENKFSSFKEKYKGLDPGKGHKYYEEFRLIRAFDEQGVKKAKEIEANSHKYYSNFRK